MSQRQFVDFRDSGFWVLDVICAAFLVYLIEQGRQRVENTSAEWLRKVVEMWRMNAVVSEFGLYLDHDWSPEQVAVVVDLCRHAMQEIALREVIPAEDLEGSSVLDELAVSTRGMDPVPSPPVVRFGEAVIALLENRLPQPPVGQVWLFTFDEQPQMLAEGTGR